MLFNKTIAYLIDTENVGSTFINLIKENKEKKDLYIFVTENAKSMSFPLLHELTDKSIRLHIIDCEIGKNSLDFYLASYLGYLIGKDAHSAYIVVSQDTGFDHVLAYWTKEGIKVQRIDTKASVRNTGRSSKRTVAKKENKVTTPAETTRKPITRKTSRDMLLKNALRDYSAAQIRDIRTVLDGVSSKQSQDVYVALVKQYKQDEGLKIYNLLKNTLRKYYSTPVSSEQVNK